MVLSNQHSLKSMDSILWNYPVFTITILIWLLVFCCKVWISCPWYLLPRIAVANQTCLIPLIILHALYSNLISSWIIHLNRSSVYDFTFCMVLMTFWDIFPVILFEFHTVKWCQESLDMVHITWTLRMFIYVFCSKFAFCWKFILGPF